METIEWKLQSGKYQNRNHIVKMHIGTTQYKLHSGKAWCKLQGGNVQLKLHSGNALHNA